MKNVDTEETSLRRQAEEKEVKAKRYNLVLPLGLYEELYIVAEKQHVSVLDVLKRFIRIGLAITTLSQSPNTRLVIHEGDKERELIFL
jgi:hypothetical protein